AEEASCAVAAPAAGTAGGPSQPNQLNRLPPPVPPTDRTWFFQCCDIGAVKVKIGYQPRAVRVRALQDGEYLELLNLFPLEGVEVSLARIRQTGVSGWGGLCGGVLQSWVQDVTSHQLHKFVAGTTAIRPFVNVGRGLADLVMLPIQQYLHDGRVLHGIRRGTCAFLRTVTVETLHTSHRVVRYIARTLDDIVAPGA
ncbi:unnamed protein product, partial [Phaeothamnion confervicola]